jgi:CRP-like cAMP-binding protein
MHPFRKFIQLYTDLPEDDWEKIAASLKRKEMEKDTLVLKEGEICRHLYFLESGLLRFFTWKDGNDITKFFTDEPYCFTSQKSFTTRQPARENIEVVEKSVIWQMTYQAAHDLLELASWGEFIRKLIQEVQGFTEEILEELQTETAESRYKKMLETHGSLLQRVPLKHLASYFGIAPQSLSRIRKNILPPKQT